MSSPRDTSPPRAPFVLIVGCPRSGTTLLQRMLDAHPQLAVANDTHFIPRAVQKNEPQAIRAAGDLTSLPLTPRIIEWVRRYHRFPRLGLPDAVIEHAAQSATTYTQFVGALYQQYAQMHGKPLGGEKTPDYVRSLPLLHRLFPWIKTLHIIRDGRDVALSTRQWASKNKKGPAKLAMWDDQPLATCALWWRRQVTTGRHDSAMLRPNSYQEVRYEQLVARPGDVLRLATAFLGLPFAHDMLCFNAGKVNHDPGLSAKKAWIAPTPGLRNWQTQMDERDIELFEALAGDLISDLGYDRRFEHISPDVAAIARRCWAWWQDHVRDQRPTADTAQTKKEQPCLQAGGH